jgi:CheY-like chemotaxis protein
MQAANVLLVNHSTQAQQVARELATRLGYVAHTASNAFEALFQLGSARIDAVVCEANLPGRNSQWLQERITQLHPGTVFVVSERGTGPEWERAIEQLQPLAALHAGVVPPGPSTEPGPAAFTPQATLSSPLQANAVAVDVVEAEVTIERVELPADLQVPADGPGADRRKAPRYRPSAELPVSFRGGRQGFLRDVSAAGALIETDAHVGPSRVFELRVGNAQDTLKAMVQVVRCDVIAVTVKGIKYRVGVAFQDPLTDSDIKKLVSGGNS